MVGLGLHVVNGSDPLSRGIRHPKSLTVVMIRSRTVQIA
jgi:hypothetical protein